MRLELSRAQVVGFAFIGAVTVAVMILLALEGPVTVGPTSTSTATPTSTPSTAPSATTAR